MRLPADYYHCFLGNGLDAVLVGHTGSMVADRAGEERCYWYKAERYYPEDRLVQIPGRFPQGKPLEHARGSGWYELAPLGRTWYVVRGQLSPLEATSSSQEFDPTRGVLSSSVRFRGLRAEVTTFLHPELSLLVSRLLFEREAELEVWMGPGVWVEEGWDTDPFYQVSMHRAHPEGTYDLGESRGLMVLRTEPRSELMLANGRERGVRLRARQLVTYFSIVDDRQGPLDASEIDGAVARGYEALQRETVEFWEAYGSASRIRIPDPQFLRAYEAALYHFKAMQNRSSGGLPVNNLRLTWSSHVFWDSFFIQRALLGANHRAEALEACRFFQRTIGHARRHARERFGAQGLKWDWEITHDGRPAYGIYLHQSEQVHNNASYVNEIWGYYEATRDREMLREFYPIIEGIARFFLDRVVIETPRGYEIAALVGVHESAERVANEGFNLTGTMAILRHLVEAAGILGIRDELVDRAKRVGRGLEPALSRLFDGRHFASAEGSGQLNMSSLAPVYPMEMVPPRDERALLTAAAYRERYRGRMVGHGNSESGFPWSAATLATIFALQGQGETALEILDGLRPAICMHGGMSETVGDGRWNMQYFGTAEGAFCTALHTMLLRHRGDEIRLFPALPAGWEEARFERLLASGLEVSALLREGSCEAELHSIAADAMTRTLRYGERSVEIRMQPGETRRVEL